MKKWAQISALPLLVTTAVLSIIPFLLVSFFRPGLYTIMNMANYLIFHNLAEFFSIVVSFSIFGLGWYAYNQNNDRHSLFISVGFLTIGLFDFMHTLGFTGIVVPSFRTIV